MSRRLRPARGQKSAKSSPAPTAAGLENPYARYYTRPRSFEQLVQQHRRPPGAGFKK